MKVLTIMLLLGPLSGFAFMWTQCYLLQRETGRLREENRLLREQVQYSSALNRQFADRIAPSHGPKPLGPIPDDVAAQVIPARTKPRIR